MAGTRLIWVTALLWGVIIVGGQGIAHADVKRDVDSAAPQEVVDGMANKAARGIANMASGWIEFPKQIYVTSQEDGIAQGILVGPFKGVGMAVARTAVGACEFATFFIAWPGFYDGYMDPPYVWQKE